MLPALLGLIAPVAAIKAVSQLLRAARSLSPTAAPPGPAPTEEAAEVSPPISESPVMLAYDGMSRRTKITEFTNGSVTSKKLYFWLGGSIVCERDGLATGFPILKQYFGQGEVRGTTKLYYATDHLGSIRELVDSAGTVQAEYRYSTYGEQTKVSGNLDCDWGYAGLWHHQASGLDLATYRAYDAANKRWISRDPLGEGIDTNLYRYCGNSPVNWRDPKGLYAEVDASQPDSQGMIDVTIILPIEFYGAGANPGTIEKLKADIEKAWTRDVGKYRVKTKVVDCPGRDDKHKNRILLYDNRLEPPPGLSSNTGSYNGDWYTSRAGTSTSPAGHEAGHSMGLGDERNLRTNVPNPGFERNIMAGTPRRGITEAQIEQIINSNPRIP